MLIGNIFKYEFKYHQWDLNPRSIIASHLKCDPFDRSGIVVLNNLAAVGFEPTRTNTGDLKSLPLDQLGQTAVNLYTVSFWLYILEYIDFLIQILLLYRHLLRSVLGSYQ